MIPNFFILGAPKCGTTALASYLRENPSIFMCEPKEPNYFDEDSFKRLPYDRESYLALFKDADPSKHLAVGEASTGYLHSKVAVPAILRFNPAARFIVMLRDPIQMVQALHSEQLYWAIEDIRDFEQAWRASPERERGERIPSSCHQPEKLLYPGWGLLGRQVGTLLSLVDRSRVHFVLFDDLTSDTAAAYGAVLRFLGVPPDGRTDFRAARENQRIRSPLLHRTLQLLSREVSYLKRRLGIQAKAFGLLPALRALTAEPGKRDPLRPAFKAELADLFREDVRELSHSIGRDLSKWLQ